MIKIIKTFLACFILVLTSFHSVWAGGFVQRMEDEVGMSPIAIQNTNAKSTDLTLTTFGVPTGAVTASGYGYSITRRYFTPEGTPVEGPVAQFPGAFDLLHQT